ncbi:MAG: hypothetical protein ACI3YH_03170 [Eubacteriales bacterium]
MATPVQILKFVDDAKPNNFSEDTKLIWLNEIEARISCEIFGHMDSYTYITAEEIGTRKLTADPPHTAVYWSWLCAMIDFAAEDYDKYQNDIQLFNTFWNEYAKHCIRKRGEDV